MVQPLIGVLALQGDVREHVVCLQNAGADVITVRRLNELERVSGLVIPGGESTTIAKLARTFELFEPIRERIASGMPTYGSCAGMILLADHIVGGTADQETFGGIDMLVRRNAFGRQIESFESWLDLHDLYDPAPGKTALDESVVRHVPYKGVFIRAPWVESVGERVVTIASISAASTGNASVSAGLAAGRIVAVRQGHLLATSFHPELTGDVRIHAYFTAMVAEHLRGLSLERMERQ